MEALTLRAESAAQSVVDRADAGEFIGETGPATTLTIGSVEFLPGSAVDSEVIDTQISTPGTVANDALIAETRLAVLEKAGSFLMDPFLVGTVTTGAAGTTASATITGESPNRMLNLTIPKGDPGGVLRGPNLGTSNLDTITVMGFYHQTNPANSTVVRNYPQAGLLYNLEVISATSDDLYVVQEATPLTTTYTPTSRSFFRRQRVNGVWQPWRVFNSIRVDNTAGRAIYQWDDTTSREQRIYGDTGWRALTSWTSDGVITGNPLTEGMAPTPGKAGHILVKRENNRVMYRITAVTYSGPTSLPHITGFTSSSLYYNLPVIFGPNTVSSRVWVGGSTMFLFSSLGNSSDASYATTFEFQTSDAWPTTLPGTAHGAVGNI